MLLVHLMRLTLAARLESSSGSQDFRAGPTRESEERRCPEPLMRSRVPTHFSIPASNYLPSIGRTR